MIECLLPFPTTNHPYLNGEIHKRTGKIARVAFKIQLLFLTGFSVPDPLTNITNWRSLWIWTNSLESRARHACETGWLDFKGLQRYIHGNLVGTYLTKRNISEIRPKWMHNPNIWFCSTLNLRFYHFLHTPFWFVSVWWKAIQSHGANSALLIASWQSSTMNINCSALRDIA